MILRNFYVGIQSAIAQNTDDTYGKIQLNNGSFSNATPNSIIGTYYYNNQTLLEKEYLQGSKSLANSGFVLGSDDKEVTIEDYTIKPLNADLTVTFLKDKFNIIRNIEEHKITTIRAWSITNTSTTLAVDVKEIGAYSSTNDNTRCLIWRETLKDKSFTLQPLQAGTFTMTMEYDLVNYSNPLSAVNFISEVK